MFGGRELLLRITWMLWINSEVKHSGGNKSEQLVSWTRDFREHVIFNLYKTIRAKGLALVRFPQELTQSRGLPLLALYPQDLPNMVQAKARFPVVSMASEETEALGDGVTRRWLKIPELEEATHIAIFPLILPLCQVLHHGMVRRGRKNHITRSSER